MKTIRIDFAPPSAMRAVIQTRPAAWLFALIGIALCIFVAINAVTLTQQKNAHQADAQRLNAALALHTSQTPLPVAITISEIQGTAVNTAIGQLNLPWRDVFDAIEAATPPAIALLALEPDAKKHLLKGMAEAKTSDDMIAYMETLKQQAFFADVVLTKHEINGQDPNRPIRFQFEAHWREAGR
jgi:Tfp pilus assembly protein PilN